MKQEFTGESWIQRVEYDTDTGEMLITIKGSKDKYACQKVPLEIYEAFKSAESKGKYFNTFIKGNPKYQHEYFQ